MLRSPGRRSIFLSVVVALALGGCGTGDIGGDDDDDDGDAGPVFGDDHPRIYLAANHDRLAAALDGGDPAATRFKDLVDLQVGGSDIYDFKSWYAALIGQLTGDASYCTYAVARTDAIVAEEEVLISAGERADVAFDSYLEVGPRIGDVVLTYDWCFDQLSDGQRTRWLAYAQQAVWNVWHPEEASWGGNVFSWSGWSIDNPSNNYYYSFLRATMLFGLAAHDEHPDATGWLDFFRDDKIGAQLVPTFAADLEGGGSREGTGYGVAMMRLWELYDLWEGSTGEDIGRLTGHTRASLLAMLHSIVPTRDRFAPIGDQSRDATASLFDYHRHYIQQLTYLFQDDPVVPAAKWLLSQSTVPEMDQPFMYVFDFLYETPALAEQPPGGAGRAYFAPGTGQLYARSSWDTDATWLSLIAGPYTESHAHHDQGSFMIYKGSWLAYDAIIESTTGIRGDEQLHNLVRISQDGATVSQREGTSSEVVALASGDGWLHVAADLTPAYDGNAAVTSVERELVYLEPDCVVVFDRVATAGDTAQIWQLNAPVRPTLAGDVASVAGDSFTLHSQRVLPAAAAATVADWVDDGEFTGGYRLDETVAGGANQFLHVLWIGDAVSDVTRSDSGGRTGVTVTFADGGSATVRFGASGVDGTLDVGDGEVALGPGVATLPE